MTASPSPERIDRCYETVRAALLAERNAAGHWEGKLSASALSTATAVMALEMVRRDHGESRDKRGSFKTPLPGGGEGQLQSRRRLKQGEGGQCTENNPHPNPLPEGETGRPEQVRAVPAGIQPDAGTAKTCSGLRIDPSIEI